MDSDHDTGYDTDTETEIHFITNAVMEQIEDQMMGGWFGFTKKSSEKSKSKIPVKNTVKVKKSTGAKSTTDNKNKEKYSSVKACLEAIKGQDESLLALLKSSLKKKGDGNADMETIKECEELIEETLDIFKQTKDKPSNGAMKTTLRKLQKCETDLHTSIATKGETIHRAAIERMIKNVSSLIKALSVAIKQST
jgi:hypothetical protein